MSVEQLANDAGLDAPRRYVVDWQRVESALGSKLPADYKEFVYWFGPGCFDDYLFVCVPGVENAVQELRALLNEEHEKQRLHASISRREPLVSLYPATGGWLPWGFTSNGDVLYWVTSTGAPAEWKIAGCPARGRDVGYFDGSFMQFMREFVWDTLDVHFIAETDSDVPIVFEPTTGSWPGEPAKRLEPFGYFADD